MTAFTAHDDAKHMVTWRRLQSNLTQITAFSNVILRYILHLLSQQTECQHVTNYQNTARIW